MQPHDASLRDGLQIVVAEAAPVGFAAEPVTVEVRGRFHRVIVAVAASAVVVVSATMAVPPDPAPKVFTCGQRLVLGDAAVSRMGLTMAVSSVRRTADDVGPQVAVTFTATAPMQITSSPPELFEVLYLKDGVIVGGGPMLNMPGDESPQALSLVGFGFEVAPGRPSTHDLGPRDTLCPSLTWRQVWSTPQSYVVVVLQGAVEGLPQQAPLGIPTLEGPLLVSRTTLAG